MPEYKLIQWDESNFDVNVIPYIKQAYDAGKYAFVSDYARLQILYTHGGIYLDTDIKVLKSLDDLIINEAFIGFESENSLGFGVIGAVKGNRLIKEVLDLYEGRDFIREDGSYDITTIVEFITPIFMGRGLSRADKIQVVAEFKIYPTDYFYPLDFWTKKMNITKNSYLVHMWAESWKSFPERMKTQFHRVIGDKMMKKFSKIKKGLKRLFEKQ